MLVEDGTRCCWWIGEQARTHVVHQGPCSAFAAQGVFVLTHLPFTFSRPASKCHNTPGVVCAKAPGTRGLT